MNHQPRDPSHPIQHRLTPTSATLLITKLHHRTASHQIPSIPHHYTYFPTAFPTNKSALAHLHKGARLVVAQRVPQPSAG